MISVCLLTKNENKYLKEWVSHHLSIGVEHFYIYDNNDKADAESEILRYFEKNLFTFVHWKAYCSHMQEEAYNDCLTRFGEDNDWIAFIDTDEFINCSDIHEALRKYESYDFVKMPWVMYNANGQLHTSDKPVRERFQSTCPCFTMNDHFKSVVQPSKVEKMFVHQAAPKNGKAVDADDIALDHYYTRSLEEWVEKIERGSCSPYAKKKYDEFFVYNPDLIEYKDNSKYIDAEQAYLDCQKKIDIRIMAHPSRRENVLKICEQLGMDESIVVYDDRKFGGDALYTARKTWLQPVNEDATHRLVLQDDILLCDNFIEIVDTIINTMKDEVISLFNLIPADISKNEKCCYRKFNTLSGAAIIMPKVYIRDCWDWIDKHCDECPHDDLMIAKYCKFKCIDMYTTIPCVVQHLGDTEYESLLNAEYAGIRMSTTYTQQPTADFSIFIPENENILKFKKKVREIRISKILEKRK